jgi:hypothetical protein
MSEWSPDHLADVQFEDGHARETQMGIDTSSAMEILLAAAGFLALVCVSLFVAVVGPASKQTRSLYVPLHEDKLRGVKYVTFPIDSLCASNRFLSFAVVPSFTNPTKPLTINVSVRTELSNQAQDTEFFALHFGGVPFAASNRSDQLFSLFWRPLGVFRRSVTRVSFMGAEIDRLTGCLSEWFSADPTFALLEAIYRSSFLALIAVGGLCFYQGMNGMRIRFWYVEQRMTVILLLLTASAINPMHNIFINLSITSYSIVHDVSQSVFAAFLKFYTLVIFDLLRFKNKQIRPSFFARKAAFGALYFVAHFAHHILASSKSGARLGRLLPFDRALAINRAIFDLAFFAWFGYTVDRSWRQIGAADVLALEAYCLNCGLVLAKSVILDTMSNVVPFLATSCFAFLLGISMDNFFVLLMLMLHWPCQRTSNKYLEPGNTKVDTDFLCDSAGSWSE